MFPARKHGFAAVSFRPSVSTPPRLSIVLQGLLVAWLDEAKKVVIGRSGGRCERCRKAWGRDVHHRKPRGMGGTKDVLVNSPANLVHLCRDCHAWVESHSRLAYEQGWKIRHGIQAAEEVPIWQGTQAVFLRNDGTKTVR